MDKRTVGENNKLKALELIYKFGWLRSQEIGLFLWQPQFMGMNKFYKKNAEALVRKLVDQKLVIARKLPLNSGTALFLSAGGADALKEIGIAAESGKDIGKKDEDGVWIPPKKWKHHLLCAGALGHLSRADYQVVSELEIRRKHNLKKYPDGIFYMDFDVEGEDGEVLEVSETFWLEVENHRKTGPNMAFMTDCMLQSLKINPLNDINEICGRTINGLGLAFSEKSKDENGHKIDHKMRVTNSLKNKIRQDLPINFISMEKYGLGVSSIQLKEVVIKPKSLYA